MHSSTRKMVCLMSLSLFFLGGCSSSLQKDQKADAFKTLSALNESPTVDQVKQAFNLITDQSIKEYNQAFELEQYVSEDTPLLSDGVLDSQNSTQESVLMQWMDENQALYQLMRNGSANGVPAYVGLVRMDAKLTTTVSFDVKNNEDVFSNPLDLSVQYISAVQNKALEDLDAKQVGYHLISEEVQVLMPFLGSTAAIPPFNNPGLYDFDVTQQSDSGAIDLTMTLKQTDTYNDQAASADEKRTDILGSAKLSDYQAETEAMSWTLHLNADGAIESMRMSGSAKVASGSQTLTLESMRSARLVDCSSNQSIGYLKDVFVQIDDQKLRQGSPFTLDLPVQNPEALQTLPSQN